MFKKLRQKGQAGLLVIFSLFIVAILVVAVLPVIGALNLASARTMVENTGNVILTIGEYNTLNAKLDALKVSADVAVVNAVIAANTSNVTLNTLLLHNENEVFLWPEAVTANCTFEAGNPANTYKTWSHIEDNSGNHFSDNFSLRDGYLVEIMTHTYSANATDKLYIIELATDAAGVNVIGRVKLRSDWTYVLALRSERIIASDVIYYRMKSEVAVAKLNADFRYYYR